MPEGFSRKDERQYKHIKDSYRERGKDEDTAEEIAARTVNRERKSEGRTKEQRGSQSRSSRSSSRSGSRSGSQSRSSSRSSSGSSSSSSRSDDGPTKRELYEQAQRLDIEGRSRMDKDQLQRAVRRERR